MPSIKINPVFPHIVLNLRFHNLQLVSMRYADRIRWIITLLGHVDSDAREAASCLLGIASSALSSSAALNLLSELISTLNQSRPPRYEK